MKTWFQNRRMKEKRKLREVEMRLGGTMDQPGTMTLHPMGAMMSPPVIYPHHHSQATPIIMPSPPSMPIVDHRFIAGIPYPMPPHTLPAPAPFGSPSSLPFHHPYSNGGLGGYLGGLTLHCPPFQMRPPMV